jgi:hypothetical protein
VRVRVCRKAHPPSSPLSTSLYLLSSPPSPLAPPPGPISPGDSAAGCIHPQCKSPGCLRLRAPCKRSQSSCALVAAAPAAAARFLSVHASRPRPSELQSLGEKTKPPVTQVAVRPRWSSPRAGPLATPSERDQSHLLVAVAWVDHSTAEEGERPGHVDKTTRCSTGRRGEAHEQNPCTCPAGRHRAQV